MMSRQQAVGADEAIIAKLEKVDIDIVDGDPKGARPSETVRQAVFHRCYDPE